MGRFQLSFIHCDWKYVLMTWCQSLTLYPWYSRHSPGAGLWPVSRLLALYPFQHRPPAHQVVRTHLYCHHGHIIFTIGVSHLTGRPLHLTETQAQGVGGAQSQSRPVHRAPGETGVHWATSGARPDNNKNIYYKNNVVDIAITSACPAAPLSPWCWPAGPWWRSAGPGRARTCRTGYWTRWGRLTLKRKRVLGSFHTLGVRIEREMNACPDRQTDIGTPCASIGAKKIWEFWKRSSEAFYICLCWSQTNCPQTGPGAWGQIKQKYFNFLRRRKMSPGQ